MTNYILNIFGMNAHGTSPVIYLLLPVFLATAYLASCISLYAVSQMFDIVTFSWTNGLYWMAIIGTGGWMFGCKSSGD